MVIYLDYFSKTFPRFESQGCGLSVSATYVLVFVVLSLTSSYVSESTRDNTYLALAWIKYTTHTCYAGPKKYPGKLSCLRGRLRRRPKNCLIVWIATVDNQCSNWVKVDWGRLVLVFVVSCQFLCSLSNKFNFKQFLFCNTKRVDRIFL